MISTTIFNYIEVVNDDTPLCCLYHLGSRSVELDVVNLALAAGPSVTERKAGTVFGLMWAISRCNNQCCVATSIL